MKEENEVNSINEKIEDVVIEGVVETKEVPIATIVINEYKDINKTLKESNKRLTTNNKILSIIIQTRITRTVHIGC